MSEAYQIVAIGLSILAFLLILLSLGAWAGGNWEAISQAVSSLILVIIGFCFAAYVLMNLMRR